MIRPLPFALGLLALAPAARAQSCDGLKGWHLDIPAQIEIGSVADIDFTGPAHEMALLMVSLGQGPVKSGYGTICLDFPLLAQVMLGLDAEGKALLQFDIPCDPALVDVTVYSQFITCRPNKGISNQVASTFIDALHSGDLCTYTQGGWGADCHGGNPDLVFVAGVHQKLLGWTVRDLIDLADQAIACALGAGPFDIDGDQIGDVTYADLNDALDAFNRNFDNCSSNLGYLGLE